MNELLPSSPLTALKGVGDKRASLYGKLKLYSVEDLVRFYPRSYLDYSRQLSIAEAPLGEVSIVKVTVVSHHTAVRTARGYTLYSVEVCDDSTGMEAVFFNSPYRAEGLKDGGTYLLRGKVEGNLLRKKIMNPTVCSTEEGTGLVPVYPLTEGLTNRMVLTNVRQALPVVLDRMRENLPEEVITEFALTDLVSAVRILHHPDSWEELAGARERIICEELLGMAFGTRMMNRRQKKLASARCILKPMRDWYTGLGFSLTGAQKRCISEIMEDMCSETPMNRLLQGDVGSGKTAVAASAACFAAENGYQTALLAPTEILAEQHFRKLSPLFQAIGKKAALLIGSTKEKERTQIREELESGEISLLIGTHAILEDWVVFRNLGLVITDEQHRFGVMQRNRLIEKGTAPHLLVMSATPIPRTLALMIYGNLALSSLDELPPGRLPVITRRISQSQMPAFLKWLRNQLEQDHRVYVVCPAIEESELEGLTSAEEVYAMFREIFPEFGVALLHGKMKPSEKDSVMKSFSEGQSRILISTTVIEVGVDVPEATVMLIENADRFGLSQLHQLRGRVGRGKEQSYCVLLSDNHSGDADARLSILEKTNDGFEIAEEDLRLRGPGDFFGQRQSGVPGLEMANLLTDIHLPQKVAEYADRVFREDPELETDAHRILKEMAEKVIGEAGTLN